MRLAAYSPKIDRMKQDAPFREIGKRLRKIRSGFTHLNQGEFAEHLNVSQPRYSNWENGARRITLDEAIKLCEIYGLTLDAIYLGRLDGLSENVRKIMLAD